MASGSSSRSAAVAVATRSTRSRNSRAPVWRSEARTLAWALARWASLLHTRARLALRG